MSKLSRWIDKNITHKTATRQAMQAASEQISFYQQQKAAMEAENARINQEREVERARVHEKQIRALRRRFSSSRFLDAPSSLDTKSTLG